MMDKKINYIAANQGSKIESAFQSDNSAKSLEPMRAHDIVAYIANKVPKKSLQWVINRYIDHDFFLEDMEALGNDLDNFFKHFNSYKSHINNLSKEEFYKSLPTDENIKKTKTRIKKEGVEKLCNSDIIILNILNAEAAAYYAAGTKWCTSNADTFNSYSKNGPIYIIIDKETNKKFQLHMHSGQFKNEIDIDPSQEEIDILSKSPDWGKFIEKVMLEYYPQLG